jgi:crotonobetainyl-CoA:carnitine CoA-transferase CaiB-like acyl-CoA transferase
VPALPVEWNGASIGDGLKVPPLGADTAAILSELEPAAKRAAGQA